MTQRPNWFSFATAVIAGCRGCGEQFPSDDNVGGTDDTGEIIVDCCCSGIKGTPVPANGSTDVYVRGTFSIEFINDESSTAVFTLTDSADADVPLGDVHFSDNGRSAWFQAAAPLQPSTSYTLTVSYSCDKSAPIAFTTSATGEEVAPNAFVGQAYALDLASALIIQPSGVNALLGSLLGQLDSSIVFVPQAFDTDTQALTFYGGLASPDGAQDLCQPTFDLPATSYLEDPFFELDAPDGLTLSFGGVDVSLLDLTLTGAFNPDATSLEGVGISATIDTRTLVPALGDALGGATGDSAVCDLIGQFTAGAVSCEACPATDPLGEGDLCLTLIAQNAVANKVDWALARVTPEDVAANATCAPPAP